MIPSTSNMALFVVQSASSFTWSNRNYFLNLSNAAEPKNRECLSKLSYYLQRRWVKEKPELEFIQFYRSKLDEIGAQWSVELSPHQRETLNALFRDRIAYERSATSCPKDIDSLFKRALVSFSMRNAEMLYLGDPTRSYHMQRYVQHAEVLIERFLTKRPEMKKLEYQSNVSLAAILLATKYLDDASNWNCDFLANVCSCFATRGEWTPALLQACFNALELAFLQEIDFNILVTPLQNLEQRMRAIASQMEHPDTITLREMLLSLRQDIFQFSLPESDLVAARQAVQKLQASMRASPFAKGREPFLQLYFCEIYRCLEFKELSCKNSHGGEVTSEKQFEPFVNLDALNQAFLGKY